MVAIVQMKLQSRLGYLIMKNWWWTKTQLPKKPFIRSVLELSYLFDWFYPCELIVGAQYQFESHNSFWEHIQTLANFAIPTTPTQEFVVECDDHIVIIDLTFLVIGEFYDQVKRSSTKNQLDRSIMLWSDVHSREKSQFQMVIINSIIGKSFAFI